MSKSSKTDWKRLAEMSDKDIDTSEIPELNDAFFREAIKKVLEKPEPSEAFDHHAHLVKLKKQMKPHNSHSE